MKLNKCRLNYDVLAQLRDQFLQNARLKHLVFDHLFTHYNDRFVTTLANFFKEEYIQDALRWTFRNLLVEEAKWACSRGGRSLEDFVKFLRNGEQGAALNADKLAELATEYGSLAVDDTRWYATTELNVKVF